MSPKKQDDRYIGVAKTPKVPAAVFDKASAREMQDCPEDYLTPLEIIKYLRAVEDNVAPPLDVMEHLDSCRACRATWNFLQFTDPVFRKYRTQQVKALIRQVEENTKPFEEQTASVMDEQEEQANSFRDEQELAIDDIARSYEAKVRNEISEKGDLSLDWLFKECGNVQRIGEVHARILNASGFAQAIDKVFFSDLADLDPKTSSREIGKSILTDTSEKLDLRQFKDDKRTKLPKGLRTTLELCVAFIMKYPSVSYFPAGTILERSRADSADVPEPILFYPGAFDRCRNEFKRLEADTCSAPGYSPRAK